MSTPPPDRDRRDDVAARPDRAPRFIITVISDIHYASAAEQARGDDFETRVIRQPLGRFAARMYRRFIWMNRPLRMNHLLDRFLQHAPASDIVVSNGDQACDSAFLGLSDDAALQSERECLEKLRSRFGERLRVNLGDHELGKFSTFGGLGGMRIESFHRATGTLRLEPFWQVNAGDYSVLGVASSLVAFPVFEQDALEAERGEWWKLREQHLAAVRAAFDDLPPTQRVILFCHDPSALPFLGHEESVRRRLPQLEMTVIGHLHSKLVLCKSRLLAGMPPIPFLGHSIKRMSTALREARGWRPFHVRLCPALAGIELLKDGGYCTLELDRSAHEPAQFVFHPLAR